MPAISRNRALAYALVLLLALTVAGRMALAGESRPGGVEAPPSSGLEIEEEPRQELVVHVVGAVVAPGLYRLPEGSRVDDAIARAGGAKPKAALELVNLASPVADGQQVIVPARGRGGAVTTAPGAPGGLPPGKVHLNSATLEQLETLPGIGPVTAQKILDYREANGAFGSVEELDAVPGIGPARLEQLLPLVDL